MKGGELLNTNYITIAKDETDEQLIKKSRFICTVHRIESEDEARSFIAMTKKAHPKANHNCYAFIVGQTPETHRSSDDGEPSGTAGIPMLDVLKGQKLTNTLAIVTRYFGGTKLGTGGLVRAYAHSTKSAVIKAGLIEKRLESAVTIFIDYSNLNQTNYFLEAKKINTLSTEFLQEVALTISTEHPEIIKAELIELLNGRVRFEDGTKTFYDYSILQAD